MDSSSPSTSSSVASITSVSSFAELSWKWTGSLDLGSIGGLVYAGGELVVGLTSDDVYSGGRRSVGVGRYGGGSAGATW